MPSLQEIAIAQFIDNFSVLKTLLPLLPELVVGRMLWLVVTRGDLDYVVNELGADYVPTTLPSLEGWRDRAQQTAARKRSRKSKKE